MLSFPCFIDPHMIGKFAGFQLNDTQRRYIQKSEDRTEVNALLDSLNIRHVE